MESPIEYKSFAYMEEKIEYAIGILEMSQILITTGDKEIREENIKHLQTVIPKAIEELKNAKLG